MEFEPEPLPDARVVKRGRPKKSNDDAAKEREADVEKVKAILTDLRKNELTGAIEYTDSQGKTVALQGNDLDMTTKVAVNTVSLYLNLVSSRLSNMLHRK